MLYNPHWDAPSMSSFEAWLETKDPNETYPYSNRFNCACAQYLKHVGKYKDDWLDNAVHGDTVSTMNKLAGPFLDAVLGSYTFDVNAVLDYTFGGLLKRVRALQALETV